MSFTWCTTHLPMGDGKVAASTSSDQRCDQSNQWNEQEQRDR